jgi:type II secretion system (T2SS) protein E
MTNESRHPPAPRRGAGSSPEPSGRDAAAPGSALEQELGIFLVRSGWLSADRLAQTLESQRMAAGRLDTCLLERGFLGEDKILEALSQVLGAPPASDRDLRKVKPSVRSILPDKVAQRLRAVPFRVVGSELWVALEDPSAKIRVDEVAAVSPSSTGAPACVRTPPPHRRGPPPCR